MRHRRSNNSYSLKGAAVGVLALLLLAAIAGAQTQSGKSGLRPGAAPQNKPAQTLSPSIPAADRNTPGRVFLEHADSLVLRERPRYSEEPEYMVLYGNVQFRKEGMFMYCDSAYFYDKENSLDAFGDVRMEQGDTLFVYGAELNYDGNEEMAVLYGGNGKRARLINRDVTLTTDVFNYDLADNVGYYDMGGTLTDKANTLRSIEGYYYVDTKDAYFYDDVDLMGPRDNDTITLVTDSLTYNTETNIARLIAPTVITSKDGQIFSSSGDYNTVTEKADLYSRSTVVTNKGNTLTGDTLFYDRRTGIGEAFGNMILTDTVNKADLLGDYGFYNELRDSAFVTGRALAMEYSQGDTLYMHGDTINAYVEAVDSMRVTNAFHRVRFYRSDVQGLCDSLSLTERDSIMRMFYHPMLWNENRQISGNLITLHLNDSTVDWAKLPDYGLIAEYIADDCYNQLAGKEMTAWFADSTLSRLYIEGNVQVIVFPMESDSTYNKYAYAESSYLDAYFADGKIDRVKMWPETTGNVTPLFLAKKGAYFLPQFRWYGDTLRPTDPYDIMEQPEGMDALFAVPEQGRRRQASPQPPDNLDNNDTPASPDSIDSIDSVDSVDSVDKNDKIE